MKYCFVTSECRPFASTGGLSDVSSALPEALKKAGASGYRIMPLYRRILEGDFGVEATDITLPIPLGKDIIEATVYVSHLLETPTYFIYNEEYFDRSELYGLAHRDYFDNVQRFILFQKAAVALMDMLKEQKPDIVHLNDWQTGLIPFFLRYGIDGRGRGMKERCLFTIHNLAYQGSFPMDHFALTNLPSFLSGIDGVEFYGNMNFIKAGLYGADYISTVSPNYAEEIKTEKFGCGMEGLLTIRKDKLVGLLNGVDYSDWDPATDKLIPTNYGAENLAGKGECKKALLKAFGLKAPKKRTLLLGMVSRMVDQKGFDIIADAMPTLMKMEGLQFVILGSGEKRYEEMAKKWAKKWPDKLGVKIGYNNELSHLIEAGSDAFMMPSKFEPCGLNQLYSLKYGTVPVVNPVGGLLDSIIPVQDGKANKGTGFHLSDFDGKGLVTCLQLVLKEYEDKPSWEKLMLRGMEKDFSWDVSAQQYIDLYNKLTP